MPNGKSVAVRDEAPVPAMSDAAMIVSIIERAARDPQVDVEKMRQLLDMHMQVKAQENENKYAIAMKLAQAEMRPVAKDCENPQTRSRYASYAALDNAIRPIYNKNGFSITFDTADGAPPDHVRVVAVVEHEAGHKRQHHIDMPADGKGARGGDVMTRTHAMGSAVTYGRRYLLQMIFNIVPGADDDGNAAGGIHAEKINEGQVAYLAQLLMENGCDRAKFLKWAKVAQLADIPARSYGSCVDAIKRSGASRR
jgi:hypothetical protein